MMTMFLPEGSLEDPKSKEAPLALKCPTSIRALLRASITLWGGLLNILVAKSATPPYQRESRDSKKDSKDSCHQNQTDLFLNLSSNRRSQEKTVSLDFSFTFGPGRTA